MPNWCVTNWKIVGPKEKVQQFCDKVNSLANLPKDPNNWFGNFFLGNLAKDLGIEIDRNTDNIRGTIDCDPDLVASLFFPYSDNQVLFRPEPYKDDDYILSFSTSSAWDRPFWLQDYFDDQDIEYGFSSTDEFGNFHVIHNTDLFPYVYILNSPNIDWQEFRIGEEQMVADLISEELGIDLGKVSNFKELEAAVEPYEDEMYEKEIEFIFHDVE